MNLKHHYDQLWNQSLQKFRNNEFQLDPLLSSANDDRYGLSLIARPSDKVRRNVVRLLDEIKIAAPNQYYYPASDLHVTILTLISCYDGFTLNQIDTAEYQKIVEGAITNVPPFNIEFKGLTASPAGILIRGYPEGDWLSILRKKLRERIRSSGLQHSMDKSYIRKTAHITAIRFKEPLIQPRNFINKITQLKNYDAGSYVLDHVEMTGNDWYQKKGKVKTVARFPLTAGAALS